MISYNQLRICWYPVGGHLKAADRPIEVVSCLGVEHVNHGKGEGGGELATLCPGEEWPSRGT
jgi:hypothetical protein